jgi:hypothetical protein
VLSACGTRDVPTIVVQGDSQSTGSRLSGGLAQAWPYRINGGHTFNVINLAVDGSGFNHNGLYKSIIDLGPTADSYRKSATDVRIFCWGGTNDIYSGDDAARTFAGFQKWLADRIAAGWSYDKIWILTPMPRTPGGTAPGGYEANRQAFIADLVADAALKGYHLVRIDQSMLIGQDRDQADMIYFDADATHLNVTGQGVVATIFDATP